MARRPSIAAEPQRTRAELLAQLEAEQLAGDPAWHRPEIDPLIDRVLALLVDVTGRAE